MISSAKLITKEYARALVLRDVAEHGLDATLGEIALRTGLTVEHVAAVLDDIGTAKPHFRSLSWSET